MATRVKLSDRVDYIGSQDWDRRLFDSLIPLPDGTSYNSYIVKGSMATALIDTVDPKFTDEFMDKISGDSRIDYIVINHAEQDHSGSLNIVLKAHPEATVLCSEKAKDLIMTHLHTPEGKIRVVKDGEEISLGDCTLKFVYAPFVHWPETMLTFLVEEALLFSCDMFGSHIASSEVFTCRELDTYIEPCKRYYAEIMMPFAPLVRKNLEKVRVLGAKTICPSHGPCWTSPDFVIGLYADWLNKGPENLALILDVTMHGSTKAMVERLTDRLSEHGVRVARVELLEADLGKIAIELVDAHTIVVATPTVLAGPHPAVIAAVALANALKPKAKLLGVMGSYGWGGKTPEVIASLLGNLSSAELLPPVMIKGLPYNEGMRPVDELAMSIAERHSAAFPGKIRGCSSK